MTKSGFWQSLLVATEKQRLKSAGDPSDSGEAAKPKEKNTYNNQTSSHMLCLATSLKMVFEFLTAYEQALRWILEYSQSKHSLMPAGTFQKQLLASPKVTEQRNLLPLGPSPWPWVQIQPWEHRAHGDSSELLRAPLHTNTSTSLYMGTFQDKHPLEYLAVIFIDTLQAIGSLRAAPMPRWFLSSSLLQPEGRNWNQGV